jgi:molybdenum cofactor cytidylyltransferase
VRERVVGLLLAAGRGRRFAAGVDAAGNAAEVCEDHPAVDGPPRPADKLLARVDGVPIARRALEALAAGCDAVVAVVRPEASEALRAALAGARLVECADADLGMGHSLAAAARAAADERADIVLAMPADLPWLSPQTVVAIARAARGCGAHPGDASASRIVAPVLADGRRGHPVAFGRAYLAALGRLTGDRGAQTLLEAGPIRRVTVDDAGILRDVDTPHDLHAP